MRQLLPEKMDSDAPSAGRQSDRLLPVVIPDHKLVRCIGRGSYGEVWLAQNMMGAYRAVKIVYRKSFQNQRPFDRELSGIRKFEPISRSHEGFIDVLHVGMNAEHGYFYYLMELGDDQTSGQNINPENYSPKTLASEMSVREKLSFAECLRFGLALSYALVELHKHGLVHRDVKPSNIIFVNGVLKLADIGLVAEINEARSYVGTEGFIPPEGPGTPQADIYSLGKVLYEASTGKDRHEFPDLPTKLEEFLDDSGFLELNEIILHACDNDVRKRYRSALDMHSDLLLLAGGKSVRRLKLLERRLAQFKRIASISTLVLAVSAVIIYQAYREWENAVEWRQRQIGENVAYGNRAVESGDLLGALPYFAEALQLDKGNLKREAPHRLQFGSTLAQCPKLIQMWFLGHEVRDGEFSPDGKKVIIPEFLGKVQIYDLHSGALYSHSFGHGIGIWSAVFSPDGKSVLTVSSERNTACVWDAVSLEELHILSHPARVYNARYSLDGLSIVTSCKDGVARVWDAKTGRLKLLLKGHSDVIRFASFSSDGQLIITASQDNTARIWNAKTGQPVGVPLQHGSWVNYAAFSPDNQLVVTACSDHKAQIWEVATGRRILIDLDHNNGVESAEFSPDGRMIVTASLDGTARLWDIENLQSPESNFVLRHSAGVTHASFSPDGHSIITTCTDGSVRIWDLVGITVPPLPRRYLYSQDGSRFLTITDNFLQVWNAASNKSISPLIAVNSSLEKAEFNRNGHFIVSVSKTNGTNHLIQVLDSLTGKVIAPAFQVSNPINGVALSDDGERLVTFGGNIAQIWDVLTQTNLSPPLLHDEPVNSAFFNPEGNCMASISGTKLYVWRADGQAAFAPLNHLRPVSYAAFSRNGSLIVTCCSDNQIYKCFAQVWDAATGRPIGAQLNHADGVLFASFSSDGHRVVTASEDYTAVVWDIASGIQLIPPLRHEDKVRTAVFSSDGKWIVTASADKTARVWSTETGDPLTPPLRHLTPLMSAKFLPGNSRIITSDETGDTWTWNLPSVGMPVEDIRKIACLLSGNATSSSQSSSSQSESFQIIWQQLRAKYPSSFTTSPQEIAAWYEFEAEESEAHQQWFAAAFYLKRLLSVCPDDRSLVERFACATQGLKTDDRLK